MKPEPETIVLWINACFGNLQIKLINLKRNDQPIRKKEILCALIRTKYGYQKRED